MNSSPTQQTYFELQRAYDHFNLALFAGALPPCLVTLQREKRTYGYFSSKRFVHVDGTMTDEIALNPSFFAVVPLTETMQTLVHEMCHLWQHHHGDPGRGRYHNEEWAAKMEAIGLMPSSTGQPGGKRTGDHVADYALSDGQFLAACESLLTADFRLSWYDRFPDETQVRSGLSSMALQLSPQYGGGMLPAAELPELAGLVDRVRAVQQSGDDAGATPTISTNKSGRDKYACPCKKQVWGKPGLNLICGDCGDRFGVVQ